MLVETGYGMMVLQFGLIATSFCAEVLCIMILRMNP